LLTKSIDGKRQHAISFTSPSPLSNYYLNSNNGYLTVLDICYNQITSQNDKSAVSVYMGTGIAQWSDFQIYGMSWGDMSIFTHYYMAYNSIFSSYLSYDNPDYPNYLTGTWKSTWHSATGAHVGYKNNLNLACATETIQKKRSEKAIPNIFSSDWKIFCQFDELSISNNPESEPTFNIQFKEFYQGGFTALITEFNGKPSTKVCIGNKMDNFIGFSFLYHSTHIFNVIAEIVEDKYIHGTFSQFDVADQSFYSGKISKFTKIDDKNI